MATRVKVKSRVVPRDEIVFRGEMSEAMSSQKPKRYQATIKSSTRRAQKVILEAKNRNSMYGLIVKRFARAKEDLFVYNVQRTLRFQAKCRDY